MFRRSSRVSTKPETVQMLQEKNAMNAAVKQAAAKKAKKITRTQKPTGTKTPAIPKTPGASKLLGESNSTSFASKSLPLSSVRALDMVKW